MNKFSDAIRYIFRVIVNKYVAVNKRYILIDTEPIEVCQPQHSQHAKAAQPFVSKGYCAAKKKYYVGAKLQVVAQARDNKLPFPFEFALATAASHDLDIAKDTLPVSNFEQVNLYGDLAYQDKQFQLDLFHEKGIQIVTPVKKKKGQQHLTLFQK
ncbi:MAG TPA: transposase, partial [Desulfobacterales bacterium]|nr:transposase [Desulfobacterales bacterium]